MSVLNQISISCPLCNNKYVLSEKSPLERELKENIKLLADSRIQSFTANFHCSGCDYSFNSDINPSNLIQTAGSDERTEKTPGSAETAITDSSGDTFVETAADQTQVIDHDILDQVISNQQSGKIEEAGWETEANLQTEGSEQDYQLPQSDFTDTFKLSSQDSSGTASSYNLKELHQSSAKFDQEINLSSSIEQEDYSKYAVDNYTSQEPEHAHRSRQQTIWDSQQTPKNYSAQDSYHDIGQDSWQGRERDSGQTLLDSSRPEQPINRAFKAPESGSSFQESSGSAIRSSGSTSMFLIIPVLVTLAVLSGLTFHLENNLKSADAVFTTLFPSSLREPPAGLFILEPNIRPLVLESGDIVNVAQGRLVNKTNKTFNSVQIEGIGFSSAGQLSQREKIMLGNPVSSRTVKLKTLLPSNIKEIQNKLVNKSIKLRPNSEQDFIFVFTEPVSPKVLEQQSKDERPNSSTKDMSSYALRIYAVR